MGNATLELQDWQKKIIGRKDRWTIFTNAVEGAVQQGAAGAIDAVKEDLPGVAKEAVRGAAAFQAPVEIMGKRFAPGIRINWIRRGIQWSAGGSPRWPHPLRRIRQRRLFVTPIRRIASIG